MAKNISHSRLYRAVTDTLASTPLAREELINKCINYLKADQYDTETVGAVRARLGVIINEMHASTLIALDDMGLYYLVTTRPVVIRIERCEREIIKAISEGPITRTDLRERLKEIFATSKTVTMRDDDTLSTYMGQILKRLIARGAVIFENGVYSLSPRISAHANDINTILTLKTDFIRRLHQKGGEFFEHYFMQLLKKYTEKHGKRVLECSVAGGSDDGGIDGIMKTEDSLGFRETVMVQTKNRIEITNETDVRGFYGAVCAKRGTRGIYAITSDFHDNARAFLDALDDCVGVNGDRVFKMAIECSYGIKKKGETLEIDEKIL